MISSSSSSLVPLLLLLLLCGDVESNPGPPRRNAGQKSNENNDNVAKTVQEMGVRLGVMEQQMQMQQSQHTDIIKDLEKRLEDQSSILSKVESERDSLKSLLLSETQELLKSFQDQESREKSRMEEMIEELKNDFDLLKNTIEKMENETNNSLALNSTNFEDLLAKTSQLEAIVKQAETSVNELRLEALGKVQNVQSFSRDSRRESRAKQVDLEVELQRVRGRVDLLQQQMEEVHERVYDFEQNQRNNLILYGVKKQRHENNESLKQMLMAVFRDKLNVRRDLPIAKASRVVSGPEVRGVRPVLVSFESFKDREYLLRQSRLLKTKANIDVTEDISRRTREARAELRKFMRKIKKSNPERSCYLEYDKLILDGKVYVYSEQLNEVIEQSEAMRYSETTAAVLQAASRPGTSLFGLNNNLNNLSRPPSVLNERFAAKSASAIPRLPPLNKALSQSLGAFQDHEEELSRMQQSYEARMEQMEQGFREKVDILEEKLADSYDHKAQTNSAIDTETEGESDVDASELPQSPVQPVSNGLDKASMMSAIHEAEENTDDNEDNVKHGNKESNERDVPNGAPLGIQP